MSVQYKQRLYSEDKSNHIWNRYGVEGNGPCNCCGALFRTGDEFKQHGFGYNKGILILDDKYGEEGDFGGYEVHHVETKQGPLTVAIRYA